MEDIHGGHEEETWIRDIEDIHGGHTWKTYMEDMEKMEERHVQISLEDRLQLTPHTICLAASMRVGLGPKLYICPHPDIFRPAARAILVQPEDLHVKVLPPGSSLGARGTSEKSQHQFGLTNGNN